MIICTSISPRHTNDGIQAKAIESWLQFGDVVTVNSEDEASAVSHRLPDMNVDIIISDKHVRHISGRPLITIGAMIDHGRQSRKDVLILNSDILVMSLPDFRKDGVTFLSREDYSEDVKFNRRFEFGFDGMYIPKGFLGSFSLSLHALGNPWWDLAFPMYCINAGIPVFNPKTRHLFHKVHGAQYQQDLWVRLAQYFAWEFGYPIPGNEKEAGDVATKAMATIKKHLR